MIVPAVPASLAPPAPFPLVLAQSREVEAVAPGVVRAAYHLATSQGPLSIWLVAVDPREPTVRLGVVTAHDRLRSSGETVSSMARRTGAVAGVNADYFDIGNTNQPLNAVVRDGVLVRTPSRRVVFDVRADRSVAFDRFSFAGTVADGDRSVPLTAVNEWPPQGGASFLTPAYGALEAAPDVMLATLVPAAAASLPGDVAGSYRVASVEPATARSLAGPALAYGPAARALGPLPLAGDTLDIRASLTPPLPDLRAAAGGGPLLVAHGAVAVDPDSPAPEEAPVRFPVSGAGRRADGTVVFAAVDGRAPALSIGLTRPEFAALFIGLGATDAMAFDSGGSATLVARVLGEADASVRNAPSDGTERAVADGVFVYSDAPLGPAARLVVRPAQIVTPADTTVPVRVALIDAAGHALGPAHLAGGDVVRSGATTAVRLVRSHGLVAAVPVDVVHRIARLTVSADPANPDAGAPVNVTASAFDERGRPIELGGAVRFAADGTSIAAPSAFRAPAHDAHIVATALDARADVDLLVGRHDVGLALFDARQPGAWHFESAPAGAPGSVALAASDGRLDLAYDFSAGARAAYAVTDLALPGTPKIFRVDVRGDRSGVLVRAAFVNRFGERRALTLVRSVDWLGWRRCSIALPDDLNPPVRLAGLYVVAAVSGAAVRPAGTLAFRSAGVSIAGTPR